MKVTKNVKNIMYNIRFLSENSRNILCNMFGAFVVKGLALLVSLFTMPAYLAYFHNNEVLGLWFTVLSVLTWILNFDLGIGNGLRNKLTIALTAGDIEDAKKYISSAYMSIGVLCTILICFALLVFDFLNWNIILNIDKQIVSPEALLKTVKIVFIGIIMQLFLKLITSVLYAIQKSAVNNSLSLITSIITLLCVSIMPSYDNDSNMIRMASVHVLAVVIPLLIASIVVFSNGKLKLCIPSIKLFSVNHAKEVLELGGVFLLIQLLYMIIMNTNEYLITLFCGNEFVTEYQIYHKIFSLGAIVFHLAMTPVWSAVTKAMTERDVIWIRKLYRMLIGLSIVGAVALFAILPFSQILVDIWLAEQTISINLRKASVLAILGSVLVFNTCLSSVSNGLGKLHTQAVFYGIGAVIKVPLAFFLVRLSGTWTGVVWANIIAMSGYCLVQPYVLEKDIKRIG